MIPIKPTEWAPFYRRVLLHRVFLQTPGHPRRSGLKCCANKKEITMQVTRQQGDARRDRALPPRIGGLPTTEISNRTDSSCLSNSSFKGVNMNYQKTFRSLVVFALIIAAMFVSPVTKAQDGQVVFVCEFGTAKSLMAASYFNQLAEQKGLAVRALARASAPKDTAVSAAVVKGLREDGIDVSGFNAVKVSAEEVANSQRVVLIGTELPVSTQKPDARLESWNNVPRVSGNFPAASKMLKQQIEKLLAQISGTTGK
jgi:arsenate reductase